MTYDEEKYGYKIAKESCLMGKKVKVLNLITSSLPYILLITNYTEVVRMKRFFTSFVVVFVLALLSVNAYADINIDISGSTFEIQNPTTVRMRDITAPGSP